MHTELLPEGTHTRQKLWSDGYWATVGKCLAAGLSVVSMMLLARVLNASHFAAYLLASSCVIFGAPIGTLGVNLLVIRMIAESLGADKPERANSATRVAFTIAIAGAAVSGTVFYGCSRWLCIDILNSQELAAAAGLVAIWIMSQSLNLVLAETFRGYRDIRCATVFGGLLYATSFAIAIAVVSQWGQVELRLVLQIAIAICAVNLSIGVALIYYRLATPRHCGTNSGATAFSLTKVFAESLPLMATSVGTLAMTQADLWIVAAFCQKEEVAIYGSIARLMMVVTMPLVIVNAVVPPMISILHHQRRRDELEQLLRKSATIAGVPAMGIMVVMTIFSGWFLTTMFGPMYEGGATILSLLCVGQAVFAWGGSAGWVLLMTGHARMSLLINVLSFALLVVAGTWFATDYGATGVAAVSAVSAALCKVLLVVAAWFRVGVWAPMSMPWIAIKSLFAHRLLSRK